MAMAILLVAFATGCEYHRLEMFGKLEGIIWEDEDRDGTIDDEEARLPGVEVQLLDDNGEILRGILSDDTGRYEFFNLKEQEIYQVKVIPPPGKAFTFWGDPYKENYSHVDKVGFSMRFSFDFSAQADWQMRLKIINAGLMSPSAPAIDTPPLEPGEDGNDTPENPLNPPEESSDEDLEESTGSTGVRVGQLFGGHECGAQCTQLGMVYIQWGVSRPIANVIVTLSMTSPDGSSEILSEETGPDGIAEFRFPVYSHEDYTLTVENVEAEGLEYDPTQNQVDSVVVGRNPQALPDRGVVVVNSFLEPYEAAMQSADTGTLLDLLHPSVTEMYGTEQCQAYLETVTDPGFAIELVSVSRPASWVWERDGQSIQIPNAYTVKVNLTSRGTTSTLEIHFALDSENGVTFFTDCGDPLP